MITIPLNDFSFIEQHNQSANHHIYIYIYIIQENGVSFYLPMLILVTFLGYL